MYFHQWRALGNNSGVLRYQGYLSSYIRDCEIRALIQILYIFHCQSPIHPSIDGACRVDLHIYNERTKKAIAIEVSTLEPQTAFSSSPHCYITALKVVLPRFNYPIPKFFPYHDGTQLPTWDQMLTCVCKNHVRRIVYTIYLYIHTMQVVGFVLLDLRSGVYFPNLPRQVVSQSRPS